MPDRQRLKIAYLSAYDPRDKSVWSGTAYSIYHHLQEKVGDVDVLGPCVPSFPLLLGRIKSRVLRVLTGKKYNYGHSFALAKAYASFFEKKLKGAAYDLIVAPSAACLLAELRTNIPVVYITDSTVAASLNYHNNLSGLSAASVKESLAIEQAAIDKASLCIFSSQWAANSAINDFKAPPAKVKVFPYGANFELLPMENELNFENVKKEVNLLFVGVYWESKGGERAYQCLMTLLQHGVEAKLTVCGCTPPEEFRHPAVEVIPFLNKNNASDAKELSELFKQAHFLILPTRFDCTPIVICEASAYAVPTLCADTGGVKGHLTEGVNGFLIDYNDKGEGYANKIMELLAAPETYVALRRSSRKMYTDILNWAKWTSEFSESCKGLLK